MLLVIEASELERLPNNFPTVTREQALQILEFYKSTLARLEKPN